MLADERKNYIYSIIKNDGAVSTSVLMKELGVSIETVRRDLLSMEEEHLLKRVHGGAVAIGEMEPRKSLAERNNDCGAEKRELSRRAARFVSEGDIIGIDSGSTSIFFAEALKERFERLTVVTFSSNVFSALAGYKDFEVILCGGHYMKGEAFFYGALTLEMLDKLYMQKAFIFPASVSLEYGIGGFSQEAHLLAKKMMERSEEIFILADSGKFEKRSLLKRGDTLLEYIYVTDHRLNAQIRHIYADNRIRLYCGEESDE